jgi:hypothetical protein
VVGFDRIDELVADASPPPETAEAMALAGTALRLAPAGDHGE